MHDCRRHRALGCVAAHSCPPIVAVLAFRAWRILARHRYACERDYAGRVLALAVSSPCPCYPRDLAPSAVGRAHHARSGLTRPHRLCSASRNVRLRAALTRALCVLFILLCS